MGPAFGCSNGLVGLISKYNDVLHFFLCKVPDAYPDLISPTDTVEMNYGFSRTFRKTTEGRA
jgi:hypothetical protein